MQTVQLLDNGAQNEIHHFLGSNDQIAPSLLIKACKMIKEYDVSIGELRSCDPIIEQAQKEDVSNWPKSMLMSYLEASGFSLESLSRFSAQA